MQEHLSYLNFKIAAPNGDLEKAAGGILDCCDDAFDLSDRLQRELDARELVAWPSLITSHKHQS